MSVAATATTTPRSTSRRSIVIWELRIGVGGGASPAGRCPIALVDVLRPGSHRWSHVPQVEDLEQDAVDRLGVAVLAQPDRVGAQAVRRVDHRAGDAAEIHGGPPPPARQAVLRLVEPT